MNRQRGHRYVGSLIINEHERHYEALGGAAVLGVSAGVFYTGAAVSVAAIAAAGIGTAAAVQQSKNQAELAKAIQKQKETEAVNEAETAAFEERQSRRRTALLLGKQQSILAASGVETTSGTPLIQDIDLTTQAELEALNIRRTGNVKTGESLFESRIAKYQKDTAKAQIPYEIATGVLGATSNVGGSLYSTYSSGSKKTTTSDWRRA